MLNGSADPIHSVDAYAGPMTESVSVLGRATALLRALAQHPEDGRTTTALARDVALPRATAHRMLESLAVEGLADRDAAGRWHLGPELYVLGMAAAARYDVTHEALVSVRRLAHETGESAFFSVRRGDEIVVLLAEDGDFPIRSHVLHEGARFDLGVVSGGLALLAYWPEAEIEAYLDRADLEASGGPQFGRDAIRHRLADTRAHGWSLNPGLVVEGSWGMAAAVFDAAGRPAWTLTLTGIEPRFGTDRQVELGRLLRQEAHRLTRSLR